MDHYFRVANHNFAVLSEDESLLEGQLSNYEPFRIQKSDNLIFTFSIVGDIDISGATPVYIDNSGELDMSRIDLYRKDGDWIFEIAPVKGVPVCARIQLSNDYKVARLQVLSVKKSTIKFSLNTALMLTFAFRTASEDTLEMHSSVIKKDGKGYMFLGKSGTGKSTHSSLWMKYIEGCTLLNDDNPIIRIIDGKSYVFGSPWSGKTPCYKQDNVEIGAIVSLQQYPENIIRKQSAIESYAALYSSCSGFKAEKSMADALHGTMEKIALSVPFYHLQCLPDEQAALLCYRTVK